MSYPFNPDTGQDFDQAHEEQPTGADGRYIRDQLLPEFWEKFASKAKDYNDADGFEPHKVLGIRGQFAEVWRKVWKLKNALWDGRTLTYEGEREILLDMIGHCFLAIAMMDAEAPPPGRLGEVPLVAGEPLQGRTKQTGETIAIKRPNGEEITLLRAEADRLWPMCGRERCINCRKETLAYFLERTNDPVQYGRPAPGLPDKDGTGVFHYDQTGSTTRSRVYIAGS